MSLQDDRTQEVRGLGVRVLQPDLGQAPHVLPQRQPLLVLVPDVGALEQRDDKVLREVEDLHRRAYVRVHGAPEVDECPHPVKRVGQMAKECPNLLRCRLAPV